MSVVAKNESLSRKREWAAQAGTVLAGILILILTKTVVMHQAVPVENAPISLTLIDPPVEPKKTIEQPVKKVTPPKPALVAQPPKVVTPVIAAPSTVKAEVVVPAAPVIPMQKTVSAPVQPAPVQRVSNGEAEGVFAQDVRSRIERKKIYPDTARDLGMSGEVEVTYELDRAGNLLKAEISSSSGFKLLDQAALRAVKSASYKSFPEDAWIGAGSKVFRTKLVFSIEQ